MERTTLPSRFRTYLLVHELLARETVAAHVRRLMFSIREGFELERYCSSREDALDAGEQYLTHRRQVAGPEAYRNDVKLLNLLGKFAGLVGVRWNPPPTVKPDLPIYSTMDVWKLLHVDLGDEELTLQSRALVQFSCATGLRRGEVAGLREADIDVDARTYAVHAPSKNGPPRTLHFADPRILDASSPFMQWLADRPRARSDREALWIYRGQRIPPEHMGSRLWVAGRKVGVLASFQRGRRSFATWLHRAGASTETIQFYLGHARIETTRGYLKLEAQDAEREILELRPRLPIVGRELADRRLEEWLISSGASPAATGATR